ncbi:divergent protein kinase domain 2A isoform X1 [Zophobas morio]|uniref:divergent protein kinase domain 2A isoform X1 n=1 Tax=Zophobas morio TaxID=2755281 RepID=UPI0030834F66
MNFALIVLVISTIAGIYIGILSQRPVSSLSDSIKCPFCYGIDLCKDVDDKRITLTYKSFGDVFYNLFSVKNLYFAEYGDKRVVLKKLGHKEELDRIRRTHVAQDDVLNFMKSDDGVRSFRPCSKETAKTFLNEMSSNFDLDQIWTILQVNVEPLILTLLSNQAWPVPKLYGRCGFLIIEQYCGLPLNHFQTSPWHVRAYLALQLLEAAIHFTHKHHDFRLYLTDISPDNIAVDDNFTLYFVDLENVILKQKLEDNKMIHYSEYFADEDFVYSEEEVCQSPISDHNVYAVCRLLLSRRAPWPMMRNGLLHSPPPGVTTLHSELFSLVEECVDSKVKLNRFYIAEELIRLLKGVIE